MSETPVLLERLITGDEQETDYLHVLGVDSYSGDPLDFARKGIRVDVGGAPTFSYERWFRFKFDWPFTFVRDFHFYAPNLVVPSGWTFLWGQAETFSSPGRNQSIIATLPLPTTKTEEPNLGPFGEQLGDQERFTNWIVLQASVNGDQQPGPMMGFAGPAEPVYIDYRLEWTES